MRKRLTIDMKKSTFMHFHVENGERKNGTMSKRACTVLHALLFHLCQYPNYTGNFHLTNTDSDVSILVQYLPILVALASGNHLHCHYTKFRLYQNNFKVSIYIGANIKNDKLQTCANVGPTESPSRQP